MSIYGGFPTRILESTYNQHLCDLISLLQSFVLHFYQSHKFILPSWPEQFTATYAKLTKLERQKHLHPRYSEYLKDLDNYLNSSVKLEKIPEKPSIKQIAIHSLKKETSLPNQNSFSSRVSSVSGSHRKRKSTGFQKSSKKDLNKTRLKGYQDMILQSILSDLSSTFIY